MGGAGPALDMPFTKQIITDVIPMVDANYRTIADREHRAMAGLSLGGTQTYQITQANLDKFSHIGIFSAPFGFPGVETGYNGLLKKPAEFARQVKVFYVSMGSKEAASTGRAIHEELRQLCRESIASQQRQIELFRTWLRDWYGINYVGEIPQSAAQDIRRLSQLYGAEFEDEFLTEFSKHHLRIIKESEKVVRRGYHEELRREAQMTITNQSRQVVQMQTWDCQWYDDCRRGLIKQAQRS